MKMCYVSFPIILTLGLFVELMWCALCYDMELQGAPQKATALLTAPRVPEVREIADAESEVADELCCSSHLVQVSLT